MKMGVKKGENEKKGSNEDLDARMAVWDQKFQDYKLMTGKLLIEPMRDILFGSLKKVERVLLEGYAIQEAQWKQSYGDGLKEVSSEMVSVVNKRGSKLVEPTKSKTTSVESSKPTAAEPKPAPAPVRVEGQPAASPSNRRRNRSGSRGRGRSDASRGSGGRGRGSIRNPRPQGGPVTTNMLSEEWNVCQHDQPQPLPTEVYSAANSIQYCAAGE